MTETTTISVAIPSIEKEKSNPLENYHDESSSSLPLGWTRIQRRCNTDDREHSLRKRKRKKLKGDLANDTSVNEDDFGDSDYLESSVFYCCQNHRDMGYVSMSAQVSGSSRQCYQGTVIFCLMDHDPKWFQGYFFPHDLGLTNAIKTGDSSSVTSITMSRDCIRRTATEVKPIFDDMSTILKDFQNSKNELLLPISSKSNVEIKPWGLLCVQEEIDECLQCQNGGYRQISMAIDTFQRESTQTTAALGKTNKSSHNLTKIVWTGGDMMRLLLLSSPISSMEKTARPYRVKNGNSLTFESVNRERKNESDCVLLAADTSKIYTGEKAIPYIEKYFSSLVRKLSLMQKEENSSSTNTGAPPSLNGKRNVLQKSSTLELMPNAAIIVGTMKVCLDL